MRHTGKKSDGFTLIEMLVALVMAGAVVTPLYVITRGIAEQTTAKQMEIEAMQRARIGMDTLIRDFSRAGLFASPNTAVDARALNRDIGTSNAQYRAAVAHLNPGLTTPDSVMLTGNFLGSSAYHGFAESDTVLLIIDTLPKSTDCTRQFDPRYAFAHITDNNGRDLDAKVTAAEMTTGGCRITIDGNDRDMRSFKGSETNSLLIAANQTVVYTVEGDELVRYFAAFTSPSGNPNGADCTLADSGTDLTRIPETRRVVADYVTDFQVWFRVVSDPSQSGWLEPSYPPLEGVIAASGGDFSDGLVPPPDHEVFMLNPANPPTGDNLTCKTLEHDSSQFGPEQVRSALIRLTVRTEKSEASLRRVEDDSASRLEQRLLAADGTITPASGEDPFAYVLRTMTTEVDMLNLAARSDLIP